MTLASHPDRTLPAVDVDRRDALVTGVLYLGLGLTGMVGFLIVRPLLFDPADPLLTQSSVVERSGLVRLGLVLELGVVLTQSLAAVWFHRLLRPVHPFAARAVAAFGMANALAVVGSVAALSTASEAAQRPLGRSDTWLMYVLSENLWAAGSVFFGLWLIPMGAALRRAGWGPRLLASLLMVGGVGYVISAFLTPFLSAQPGLLLALAMPATVGEFWMIGWLIRSGLRR